jgi:NitT/TauT family transport system substrate-binding protein
LTPRFLGEISMKRMTMILLVLFLTAATVACGASKPASVLAPSGTPALAALLLKNDPEKYQVDIVNGSDPLLAAFASKTHDAILAPTNLGAKLYQGGLDYVYAGTITWGNFYLFSRTPEPFDLQSLHETTIVSFGQNQISDIILKYILQENGIVVGFQYVDSVAAAAQMILADSSLVILTAEPTLSILESMVAVSASFDLQAEYARLTGSDSYPQAGLFLKKSLSKAKKADLIEAFQASIAHWADQLEDAADLAVTLEYGISKAVLMTAIPNSRLRFASAADSRADLETLFTMILSRQPALIGGALPDDDFYYLP